MEELPQRAPRKRRRRPEAVEAEPDASPSMVQPPEEIAGLPDGQQAQQSAQEQLDDRPELRADAEAGQNFEWGETLEEAFAASGLAIFNYMTPLEGITATLTA
eukprot:jgi/Astpho2/145/Aster-04610